MAKSSSQGWALDRERNAEMLNKIGCALDKEGIAEGNQAVKQRKYEAARLKFEEAERLTTDESDRTLYRNNQALMLDKIGDILHSNADYTGAIQKYDAAIALNNDKVYHADKANSLIQLGRYQDAITSSEEALRLDGNYNRAKNTKARAYSAWASKLWNEEKYTESAAKYKLAYETCTSGYENEQLYRNNWYNSQAAAYNQEGHRLKVLNRFREAISEYERAYNECPDVEGVYRNNRKIYNNNKAVALNAWGWALGQEGNAEGNQATKLRKYEAARLKFEEAEMVTTDESDRTLYRNNQSAMLFTIGLALEQEGDAEGNQATKQRKYEEARLKFEEAERVTTSQFSKTLHRDHQALMLQKLGDILHSNADYTGAIQKYDAAIALTNDKVYHADKAKSLIELDRYEDSIVAADKSLRLDGNYNRARDIKATALCKQGWALDREGNAEGNQATKQRKYEAARLKFEEAERVTTYESDRTIYRKNQALILEKLGDILHSNADYTGAIQKYDAAIALTNDKAYHVDKANSLIELDRYQDAITSSEEALRLDSDYNLAKDIKATALCKQGWALDREGNAERNQVVKQTKYEEARLKFEEAERLTTDESDRTIYRDHQAVMLQKLGDKISCTIQLLSDIEYDNPLLNDSSFLQLFTKTYGMSATSRLIDLTTVLTEDHREELKEIVSDPGAIEILGNLIGEQYDFS
jgi:tetratricopeptide (TPR) repeat protein